MADINSWVDKYRPEKLDDIYSQTNIIKALKYSLLTKNIPHLIFYGPSGSGKTSTILALSKELFGDNYKDRIIQFNASDERGINIIRDKIKIYAKQSIKLVDKIPPWKIIILDDAETLTTDSQFALRRIIEQYSKITRFCIICNYFTNIIEPIISRCCLCRFKPINSNDIFLKLNNIIQQENINCNDNIINNIIQISNGDLRKAINLLEKYSLNKNIDNIFIELSGNLPNDKFNNLIQNIINKNINTVDKIINEIYNDGYSLINQILLFYDYIINLKIDDDKKIKILFKIAEIDQNLIKGGDEYIQYLNLIYYIMITI